MRKKHLQILTLTIFFLLLLTLPAFAAEKVKVSVNGEQAIVDTYLQNGVTMIGVNSFARLSGADIEYPSVNSVKIIKNDIELVMTLNQKEALLGEKKILLPAVPFKSGEEIYIPLRPASDACGYEITWNSPEETVALKINETRDGMTPQELLLKSNQVVQDINTYSMEGSLEMKMDITANGKPEAVPNSINTTLVGQIQSKPMQVHIIQKMMLPKTLDVEMPEMIVETYMTEDKMYLKAPEQEWTVQDMPFSPEFWQKQQDIQSNPLKAAEQMAEMGILLNYGNDTIVEDKEYYVVNATLDMNKFQEGYQKVMEQALQGMPAPDNQEQTQQMLQKLLDSAQMDYYYTVYIDKKTLLNDLVKFDVKLNFIMELPEIANEETGRTLPQEIKMEMHMIGQFTIKDAGKPFVAPDVKNAVPLQQLIPPAQAE